ncbi:MAG TPA: 3-methyl-2-oxobutanoate hydroxymethyltransferase [Candidatus Dormibacteraeota bacterium]|nr:3-methyl-2-oxobutanoate hydroxymethyltransferase [Candidatus Dormibacteraeota bacterium]
MTITIRDLQGFKAEGKRFAMLTAYDCPTAQIIDEAGVPVILVGDSIANNVLGYPDTLPVTMDEMLHHTRAVRRGVTRALVVGDLPFMSYQVSVEDGMRNAGRFLKEAGANAVKLEGPEVELTSRLSAAGIPVMAHVGLTPQSVNQMGGYRVQGKTEDAADRIEHECVALQRAGAFAIVLEGIPAELGRHLTGLLAIPTIGIGAGPHCDGQVLVFHDMIGLNARTPKFVKQYAQLRTEIGRAVGEFISDVQTGAFPDEAHSYGGGRVYGGGAADQPAAPGPVEVSS